MKRITWMLCIVFLAAALFGCTRSAPAAQIAATTLPVYDFTSRLCQGTDITVTRLVTEDVSCLHDYTLQVSQMRAMEEADYVVISGAGLEDFMDLSTADALIDASEGIAILECAHTHDHDHDHGHDHSHEEDPHIWLSIENARAMAENICDGLFAAFPALEDKFIANMAALNAEFDKLQSYADANLTDLSCRELVTFHDGFTYLADDFGLTILEAIEEESGSEASAKELTELIELVDHHKLPAIFTERNGSVSAASVIQAETGAKVFDLDMAMAGNGYFEAMYHNIDTLKEALG